MMTAKLPRYTLWLPPLGWAALIFALSCWSGPEEQPMFWFEGFDKIIHMGIYALLATFLLLALHFERGFSLPWASLLACILTILYGISDEWHQSFVASRSAEIADLWADAMGGCTAFATAIFLAKQQGVKSWIEQMLKQK